MKLPELFGDRLRLRQLVLDDVQNVFDFTSNPSVTEFLSWDAHQDQKKTESFISHVISTYEDEDAPSQWGIELVEEGRVIGITGFISLEKLHERAEIAFIMSPDYAGKGYMTEANQLVLKYGFESLDLNRIQAKAELGNLGSRKTLTKIGMKEEGTLIDFLKIKGTFRTYMYFASLKRDYSPKV